jgi:hypothetical protein
VLRFEVLSRRGRGRGRGGALRRERGRGGALRRGRAGALALLTCSGTLAIGAALLPAAARADGPGVGTPAVASVGDSYVSGEGGRWAGNSNSSESLVDALGPTAYYDNSTDTGELIPGCHRSKSNEAMIGSGTVDVDLACSGAETATQPYESGDDFKPGLDFYNDGDGHEGQALLLQQYAQTHNVKMVILGIGGNNYNFAGIVEDCVADFLDSPSWWPDYCSTDSSVSSEVSSSDIATQTAAIKQAILNIDQAMLNDGYTNSQFTIMVQDYPSPIPTSSGFRYSQSGYTRQDTGGCGFWNTDANWANSTLLPDINNSLWSAAAGTGLPNIKEMQIQSAFDGRRLCENTVNLVEDSGYAAWNSPGAVNHIEWFNQVRTVSTLDGDYSIQEDLHPDYYAQMALRNCMTQAWHGGAPVSGSCSIASGGGLNSLGEPNMTFSQG